MEWISRLSTTELQVIIDGISDGSLRAPFTDIGISRLFGNDTGRQVCSGLNSLSSQKLTDEQICVMLRLVQDDRRIRSTVEVSDHIDLVWTGPEVVGTINRDTKVVVQELFREAKKSVLIAGFALYQGKDVFKTLAQAIDTNPDLKVDMYLNVHRQRNDTTCAEDLVKRFIDDFVKRQWAGKRLPAIYYDPRSVAMDVSKRSVLHAKCIVIDQSISLITSANFTEAAQVRNIEAGALIRLKSFSQKIHEHFESLGKEKTLKKIL